MQPLLSEGAGPTPATKHHDRAPEVGLKAQALPLRWSETGHTGPGDKSQTNLDSMSRLAASAYLKSRRLASSRNLIRDNLGQRARRVSLPTLAWAHSPRGWGRLAWLGGIPDGNVVHDFAKHGR